MKICSKCKYLCDNDTLHKCPKCNSELTLMENYSNHLEAQGQLGDVYLSKEDRMYEDIHTIKNIMVAFTAFIVIAFVLAAIMVLS